MLGNFPQAFSHVALVNTANNLTSDISPGDGSSVIGFAPQGSASLIERPSASYAFRHA